MNLIMLVEENNKIIKSGLENDALSLPLTFDANISSVLKYFKLQQIITYFHHLKFDLLF